MAFDDKYRPTNLKRVIGHETAVTRLQGMINSDSVPHAIAFFGPTSAGKTTLARAFAADVNGLKSVSESRDYIEKNAGAERSIEHVREWIGHAKYKPFHKKRIFVIDEAQGLLANQIAANAILKPLEKPSKDTIFVLCSMEPSKFKASETGRAMLNRCSQFVLEPHTTDDMLKQAKRIVKGEKMSYVDDKCLQAVVRNCMEMRTLCHTMESLQQFYHGLEKKRDLTKADIQVVLNSAESSDERLAVQLLAALYQLQYAKVHRMLLDVVDGFSFVTALMRANNYVLNTVVLNGERHRKVWASAPGKELFKIVTDKKITLGTLAAVGAMLSTVKVQVNQFAIPVEETLAGSCYTLIRALSAK